MIIRVGIWACLALFAVVPAFGGSPAAARGWQAPSYGLELSAFGTSMAFPGSIGAGPDQGLDPRAEVSSAVRLSSSMKLGLTASGGGHVQQEFSRGNYGWLGLGARLNWHRTTATLAGEWTPRRNKFPTDPEEGGEYHAVSLTAGLRQPLGPRTRVRVETSVDREKFVPHFSTRDAIGTELAGQVVFTPQRNLDLRVVGSIAHDEAAWRNYTKSVHLVGGGAAWRDSLWSVDLGVRSGVCRYANALLGDSNFQRRDQWIELRLRVTRELRPDLVVSAGTSLLDQTSSRFDRNYAVGTFTLGLEWSGRGR